MAYESLTDRLKVRNGLALLDVNTFGSPIGTSLKGYSGYSRPTQGGGHARTPPRTVDLLAAAVRLGGGRDLGCRLEGLHRSLGKDGMPDWQE